MRQIIVFAGTTEGREISRWLADEGVETLACVATEYGRELAQEGGSLEVLRGRLSREEMEGLFRREGCPLVLDATHPYAAEVSANIREACENTGCGYLRFIRPQASLSDENCIVTGSVEEAVRRLAVLPGRVLVTTGSKELHRFTQLPDFRERVFARVLPSPEAAAHCAELGFPGSHVIGMQGPFSEELNLAMLRQIGASWLVTKESGKAGGFAEKLSAARQAGAGVILVGRPPEQAGVSVEEGIRTLQKRFSLKTAPARLEEKRTVVLAGIGMGVPENMTEEVRRAFRDADCILGAGRMLESLRDLGKPLLDAYDPEVMTDWLLKHREYQKAAVALSGDVGFYSGAKRLRTAFEQAGFSVELLPGVSSAAYLCSRLKISWEDVKLMSVHGRRENLIAAVRGNFRTFTLLGGRDSVKNLCEELLEYGLDRTEVTVGEQLHYPKERIVRGRPEELLTQDFDGLCVALIENPDFCGGTALCIPDEEFLRGGAPMTKSEIRCLSVAKLRLQENSQVYDVGAGTGSVSVEAALQTPKGRVWAVEKNREAAGLIRENARKFRVSHVEVVEGEAPEALEALPAPTHAFIGGSSGNLKEILEVLLRKNPSVRVVINAVTLETVGEASRCLRELPFEDVEILQVQVAKAKTLGNYHLMTGQNPVYIFAGQGNGRDSQGRE